MSNDEVIRQGDRWRVIERTRTLDTGGGTGLPQVWLEPGDEITVRDPWAPRLDWFCCTVDVAGVTRQVHQNLAHFAERIHPHESET